MKKKLIPLIIINVIAVACFFLAYGPVTYFRDFIITTSMTTMRHKWIARTLYSENTIRRVMGENHVSAFPEGSDTSRIVIGGDSDLRYASKYERQILERDKDAVYKLIEFDFNGYNAYIVAIYDPSRVSLIQTAYLGTRGETLVDMARRNGAKAAINGGGFEDHGGMGDGGRPQGVVIKNGQTVWSSTNRTTSIAGFTTDNKLLLINSTPAEAIRQGMRDGITFGPFLIVNGVSATITGNGGWGINPRTVLAQRKDGIVLFLIVDGNGVNRFNWNGRGGASMNDLITILEKYGAYNAVNMDGGASTTLVIGNRLHNQPMGYSATGERWLPNGWMVK